MSGERYYVPTGNETVVGFALCRLPEILKNTPATFVELSSDARTSARSICRSANMKEHEFTLILATDPTEDDADTLYGIFADGTISTIAGTPQIRFHREANSLEEALRSAIGDVRSAGFDVARVEMVPNAVATPA
jgi:hypothetical protein